MHQVDLDKQKFSWFISLIDMVVVCKCGEYVQIGENFEEEEIRCPNCSQLWQVKIDIAPIEETS